MREVIQKMLLGVWLASLDLVWIIHVTMGSSGLLFSVLSHTIAPFTDFTVNGHFVCFQFMDSMNGITITISVCVFCGHKHSVPWAVDLLAVWKDVLAVSGFRFCLQVLRGPSPLSLAVRCPHWNI